MKTDSAELLASIHELKEEIRTLKENLVSQKNQINSSATDIDELRQALREGTWNTLPQGKISHGWDQLVDPWVDIVPTIGDKIPSAYRIWQSSHRYFKAGVQDRADRCERLNYLFHNSYIPASLELRGEVIFAYGGIGLIIHRNSDIHPWVTVGANVTIGGNGSQTRTDERTGKLTTVPQIGTLTVIGAGANVTGGIDVAPMTIIAPNSVVTKSTAPGAIMGGIPAKVIGQVTMENALKYKAKFLAARSWSDEKYLEFAEKYLPAK